MRRASEQVKTPTRSHPIKTCKTVRRSPDWERAIDAFRCLGMLIAEGCSEDIGENLGGLPTVLYLPLPTGGTPQTWNIVKQMNQEISRVIIRCHHPPIGTKLTEKDRHFVVCWRSGRIPIKQPHLGLGNLREFLPNERSEPTNRVLASFKHSLHSSRIIWNPEWATTTSPKDLMQSVQIASWTLVIQTFILMTAAGAITVIIFIKTYFPTGTPMHGGKGKSFKWLNL